MAPTGVDGEGEQVGVGPADPRHGRPDQLVARRDRHQRRLALVQRLDDVAAVVGRAGGRAGGVHQLHDVLEGDRRFVVVERQDSPGGRHSRHRSTPADPGRPRSGTGRPRPIRPRRGGDWPGERGRLPRRLRGVGAPRSRDLCLGLRGGAPEARTLDDHRRPGRRRGPPRRRRELRRATGGLGRLVGPDLTPAGPVRRGGAGRRGGVHLAGPRARRAHLLLGAGRHPAGPGHPGPFGGLPPSRVLAIRGGPSRGRVRRPVPGGRHADRAPGPRRAPGLRHHRRLQRVGGPRGLR